MIQWAEPTDFAYKGVLPKIQIPNGFFVVIFKIFTTSSMEPQVLGGTGAIPKKLWYDFHQNFCICT